MGIVFPLVGPLAMRLSNNNVGFLHQCFGCIMGASTFGNICSPLADTSILTVLATRCSLPTHIGTVFGYTALVGAVAVLFGDLAVGLGLYGPVAALGVCFLRAFTSLPRSSARPRASKTNEPTGLSISSRQ